MRSTLLALALLFCSTGSPAVGQPPPGAPRTARVFALKNADAEKLRVIVLNIFNRQGLTASVDSRTNSLVVAGDADTLEEVRKLIEKLDRPPKT
ncbi:MAG: hypothetical protein FJ304_20035 [Planctomycetes bacterium]|nr:hypothetical protein [Planctomycetota bacterium]